MHLDRPPYLGQTVLLDSVAAIPRALIPSTFRDNYKLYVHAEFRVRITTRLLRGDFPHDKK
jgi:hypothetical protein